MSAPAEINTFADLESAVISALERTVELRQATPEYEILGSILHQLEFIQQHLDRHRKPATADRERIILGVQAVRELEDSDPDYARQLMEIDYAFRHWENLK